MWFLWIACVEPRLTLNCRQLIAEQSSDCGTVVFASESACETSGCTEAEVDDILEWAWCENDACLEPEKAEPCEFPDVAAACSI